MTTTGFTQQCTTGNIKICRTLAAATVATKQIRGVTGDGSGTEFKHCLDQDFRFFQLVQSIQAVEHQALQFRIGKILLTQHLSTLGKVCSQGQLAKIGFDGSVEKVFTQSLDMESVTIDPETGDLYLGCESNWVGVVRAPEYKKAEELGGLVSGEHGIGYAKKSYMKKQYGNEQIALMQGIKAAFDPKNILNPGKVCY